MMRANIVKYCGFLFDPGILSTFSSLKMAPFLWQKCKKEKGTSLSQFFHKTKLHEWNMLRVEYDLSFIVDADI
jgi:hypothetical protein